MKKKLSIKFMVALLMLTTLLAGCSTNALLDYNNAVQKTEDISRGKMSLSIKVDNNFSTDGLTEETIRNLKKFEKIEMSLISSFDKNQVKSINDVYFNLGVMGIDTMIYSVEDFAYIKLPMTNGYIKIELNELERTPQVDTTGTENIVRRITNEWIELLETENVVKGEKSIMTTEDGEVKVTKFSVNPTENQLRLFLKKIIAIVISEKDGLEELIQFANADGGLDFDSLVNAFEQEIEEMETITFNSVAFIDIDGYIVRESIEIYFENYNPKPGQVTKRTVVISQENWDNEMDQNIIIPDIPPEDLIDINEAEGLFRDFQ